MQHSAKALAPLTLFLVLSAGTCGQTKRVVESIPTPPERLICERTGTRPSIPPEHKIDWSQVRTVDAAKLEHQKFVDVVRNRDGIVAGYVLKLEGVNFTCWTNMQWRRDFEGGLGR